MENFCIQDNACQKIHYSKFACGIIKKENICILRESNLGMVYWRDTMYQ